MTGQLLKALPSLGKQVPYRWYHDIESAFWLCYLASIRFDKDKRLRYEFRKIHNHPDYQKLGKYKINWLLRFKVGNEERYILPLDWPAITEILIMIGAFISPYVTELKSVDADRVIAQRLAEYIIRELWKITHRDSQRKGSKR